MRKIIYSFLVLFIFSASVCAGWPGDDLGNHKAKKDINMNSRNIISPDKVDGVDVSQLQIDTTTLDATKLSISSSTEIERALTRLDQVAVDTAAVRVTLDQVAIDSTTAAAARNTISSFTVTFELSAGSITVGGVTQTDQIVTNTLKVGTTSEFLGNVTIPLNTIIKWNNGGTAGTAVGSIYTNTDSKMFFTNSRNFLTYDRTNLDLNPATAIRTFSGTNISTWTPQGLNLQGTLTATNAVFTSTYTTGTFSPGVFISSSSSTGCVIQPTTVTVRVPFNMIVTAVHFIANDDVASSMVVGMSSATAGTPFVQVSTGDAITSATYKDVTSLGHWTKTTFATGSWLRFMLTGGAPTGSQSITVQYDYLR